MQSDNKRFASDIEDASDDDNCFINRLKRRRVKSIVRNTKPKITRNIKNLAVVDLDETLIDTSYKIYPGALEFLKNLRVNHYIFLWTMGNEVHYSMFIKSYPEAGRYIDQHKCGLEDGTKPVNVARAVVYQTTKKYYTKSILIDDNECHLNHSYYDHSFNVLKYLSDASSTTVDYVRLLHDIKKVL